MYENDGNNHKAVEIIMETIRINMKTIKIIMKNRIIMEIHILIHNTHTQCCCQLVRMHYAHAHLHAILLPAGSNVSLPTSAAAA
jgi:transcriptional regulator of met regulon